MFQDTIRALNSLQTNAAVLEQIRKERGNRTMLNSIPAMEKFLKRIGIEVGLERRETMWNWLEPTHWLEFSVDMV